MTLYADRSTHEIRSRLVSLGLIIIALSAVLLIVRFSLVDPAGIVDDFYVYFASSRWLVEAGRLYVNFPSEYLLLPNLWFAVPRAINALLAGDIYGFSIAYVALVGLAYFIHYYVSAATLDVEQPRGEIIAILLAAMSPVLVQLILLRFDFLLVILVFYALFALKNGRIYLASALFGFAIAAKGYPLVYGLAVAAYIGQVQKPKHGFLALAIMALPTLILLSATWGFAGFDGMISPFLFHARRTFDSDSVYQLFALFFDPAAVNLAMGYAVKFGTLALAVTGAFFVRNKFEGLARIMAFQTFGLLVLSPITSPQFVLWALPIMYFVADTRLSIWFCVFALFSNFWLVREFGLPTLGSEMFWIANLALRCWLFIAAAMSYNLPHFPFVRRM